VILLHWIVGFGVVNLERFRFGSLADVIQRLILLSAHALALVAAQVDLFRPVKRNGARFNLCAAANCSAVAELGVRRRYAHPVNDDRKHTAPASPTPAQVADYGSRGCTRHIHLSRRLHLGENDRVVLLGTNACRVYYARSRSYYYAAC
jgi:hypothetical protein